MKPDTPPMIRALGRWDLAGLTINSTIGAGILGLPGKVYGLVGIYSVGACLAGGVLMGLVAACYAEASSRYPGTGGTVLYARAAFGARAGFLAGWLAIVTRVLAYASITNLLILYAAGLLPALATPAWRVLAITLLTAALGMVTYRGVALSARTNGAFTVAKLLLLGGFVAAGLVWLLPLHLPPPPPPPPWRNWAPAVVLMLFAVIGMDSTVVNGQEMRDPRRAVPFGLFVGMLVVVTLYSAILLTCAGVVPHLAASQRPLFDGAVAMLGPAGGVAVVCTAVISTSGTLFAILFTGPRLVFALADGGQLPQALAAVHPRFGTPAAAVVVHTLAAWALAVTSSFLGALTASTLTRLMLYGLTAASLLVLRRRGLSEQPHPLLLPGGGWIGAAATLLCLWLMTQSDRAAWVATLCCLALGAGLHAAHAWGASGGRLASDAPGAASKPRRGGNHG